MSISSIRKWDSAPPQAADFRAGRGAPSDSYAAGSVWLHGDPIYFNDPTSVNLRVNKSKRWGHPLSCQFETISPWRTCRAWHRRPADRRFTPGTWTSRYASPCPV